MATFKVTNTQNSGLGSLRQAILNANTTAGKDLIKFEGVFADTIADTITLGGSSLIITDDLSIDGTGSNLLTISGNYNPTQNNKTSRVFEITNGVTVEIEGLRIANGYATDTRGGGGIYNAGNLTLNNATISNNFSGGQNNIGNNGGGIYNSNSGVLTLNSSSVINNYSGLIDPDNILYAGNGGGIYNSGIVTLNNSTINANSAGYYDNNYFYDSVGNNVGNGAGVYNTGSLTANNSTVNNNRGIWNGTGIYNTGTVNLSYSSVNNNETYNGFSGIVSNSKLTIQNSSVSNNQIANIGGASSGINSSGTLIISNSNINNNFSYWISGLLHSGTLTVTNSSINGNSGRNSSGLIANGIITIDNSTINNNFSDYDFSHAGLSSRGTVTVSNSTISNNYSNYGNAGLDSNNTVTVSYTTISGNRGGYAINNSNRNSSAIRNLASGNLTVINSTITNNSEADGTIVNYGVVTVVNSTISDNLTAQGGGILNYGTATVVNSTINNNLAGRGAGISNFETSTVNLLNSTISGNQSSSEGGGIYNSGTLNVSNSTIALNQSYYDDEFDEFDRVYSGAGIYNAETGIATIKNSIIAGNNNNFPGAINPDVVGNFISNGHNLIGNLDGSTGFNSSEQLQVSISEVIDTVLRDNGGLVKTHGLVYGSPAINRGKNADVPADIADLDKDGNISEAIPFDQRGTGFKRISGSRVDIGAYEIAVINGTSYPNTLKGTVGNDIITGLRGRDLLTGLGGADAFVYTSLGDSGDTITDFETGTDKIVLKALLRSLNLSNLNFATAIAGGYLRFQTQGTQTIVLFDVDGSSGQRRAIDLVTLRNVKANAINDTRNFVF